jgi:hypothetical protein
MLEALLLAVLLLAGEAAGLLLPAGLLAAFPEGFPDEGLLALGLATAGFSSVATGWDGLS